MVATLKQKLTAPTMKGVGGSRYFDIRQNTIKMMKYLRQGRNTFSFY